MRSNRSTCKINAIYIVLQLLNEDYDNVSVSTVGHEFESTMSGGTSKRVIAGSVSDVSSV